MEKQNLQTKKKSKNRKPRKLVWYQIYLLKIVSIFIRLWTRTLRFHFGADVRNTIETLSSPFIPVLWHNRLFVVPEFYTRYFKGQKMAAIVSASSAGAWLAELLEQMGIKAIRGSKHRRGTQAFREMLQAIRAGYIVGITPDGSHGPIYEMKEGLTTLALRTKVPILLLSYNFKHAWCLNTWDRFYIPFPFSQVEVQFDLIPHEEIPTDGNIQDITNSFKTRLNAITVDNESFRSQASLNDNQNTFC